jgi:TetR/AcrR family tetracycline transcriptional repressor
VFVTTNSAEPDARAPRRTRADIVAAALVILDRQGLPDLTMRNLASSLGLQPSALYWHFPNKQTLLAAVADEIVSRTHPGLDPAGDWQDAVRSNAVALHDALLAFKDGAEVVSSTLALGLGADEASARLAVAIRRGGFDDVIADRSAEALLHFVIGQTWHEQQRLQADSLGVVAEAVAAEPGSIGGRREVPQVFELGVNLFLAGLDAQSPRGSAMLSSAASR